MLIHGMDSAHYLSVKLAHACVATVAALQLDGQMAALFAFAQCEVTLS